MIKIPVSIRYVLLICLLAVCTSQAWAAGKIEILWLGHATVKITSVDGKVIVIDPSLKTKPNTPDKYRDLKALGKVDLILVTHGHSDHVADAGELAKLTGAKVVGNYELILQMVALGLLDKNNVDAMNKGGTITPIGPKIKITMVPAEHSSSLNPAQLNGGKDQYINAGAPVGYVIEFENGFKVYHSGDTDVFAGMDLIGKRYKPDLAMVCIGGYFTMGPEGAAYALKKFIKPKMVMPIHYGTWPLLTGTPAQLKKAMGKSKIKILDVKIGEPFKI